MSGGTAVINHSFVVANSATSKGTYYQTGGTMTVRDIEMNRNSGSWDLTTENSTIIINGGVFNQHNTGALVGYTSIGQFGKGRFEVQSGQANLREVRASQNANSRATLNVTGGILRIQDALTRTDTSAASAPSVNLTGGELELTPTISTFAWQTNLNLQGSLFDPGPSAVVTVNVGSGTTLPGNFSMTSGSWDLDLAPGVGVQDSAQDRIIMGYTATPATGSLLGGTLNLKYLSGYVPAIGDSRLIVQSATGGVSSLGSITINAPGGDPNWTAVLANGNRDIRLVYVPEPGTCVLAVIGLMVGLSGIRRRS
jgi:hypothetical protein